MTRGPRIYNGERTASSKTVLGILDGHMPKKKRPGALAYIIHRNSLKMD